MAEADAGEVPVREQDSDPLSRRLTCGDHFNAGDVIGVMAWLPGRQRFPGPRAVTGRLECHRVERGRYPVTDDAARLSPRRPGKDTRAARIWRQPPLTEGSLNLGTLPLNLCSAARPGCHDRMVAGTSRAFPGMPGTTFRLSPGWVTGGEGSTWESLPWLGCRTSPAARSVGVSGMLHP